MWKEDPANLIAGAYDAALQDELWAPWTLRLFDAVGAMGGTAFLIDSASQSIMRVIGVRTPPQAAEEYLEGYWMHDPQVGIAASFRGLGSYRDTANADTTAPGTQDYLRWQASVAGFQHSLSAIIPLGDELRLTLCMHNGAVPVTARMRRSFDTMLPDIQRAATLAFRYGELLQNSFWEGINAVRSHKCAFLLDERGQVMRYTQTAADLLSAEDGMALRDRRLLPTSSRDVADLSAAIEQAVRLNEPRASAVRIHRPSGKSDLICAVHPLQRSSRHLAPLAAAALAVVIDPAARASGAQALHAQAFNLTRREADLAGALLGGHSVESAAAALSLSMPTARTHLSRIFGKTGTTTQARLIALLGRISSP